MLLPCALIKLSCLTAISCCAIAAPAPSNKAPATTTVRIIGQFSVSRSVSKRRREPRLRGPRRVVTRIPRAALYSRARQISQVMPALRLADRDPDPLRGGGHVDVADLVFAMQFLEGRINHRRTGTDRAGLACALH